MTYRFILALLVAVSLSGCGSGVSAMKTASGATSGAAGTGTASTQILLQGVPPSSVTVGAKYSFRPSVSSGNNGVTFAIEGQPSWTTFDTTTGTLSGTPATRDVGLSGLITIIASDGANTGALGPFTISVSASAAAGLTISGTPIASVVNGSAYSFTPATTDPSGVALTFSVKNAPSWATFNSATGELSGTPTAADVATYSNITIGVSNGTTSVSLPAFAIAVTQIANGSATLSWTAPTQNTNGTPLTNLAGYRIYYGTSETAMTQTVQIANSGIVTDVVSNLSPGTWYFSIRAYTSANVESVASAVASKAID
jgi:hypothetical protein